MALSMEEHDPALATVNEADRAFYGLCGRAGIAGGILGIVSNAAHPRPGPSDLGDQAVFLEMIADFTLWRLDHLLVIVSLLLGLVALVGLARSLDRGPAAVWARLALPLVLVGGAVAAVSFTLDGVVLAAVADDWASAGGAAEQAAALARAETLGYVDTAVFSMTVMSLFGVAQLLYGAALWLSPGYPRWIAWAALAGGVAGLASGVWMWLSGEFGTGNFLVLFTIASLLLTVWLLAASVRLTRLSRATP